MESHVIDERITRLVSLFLSAMSRANIRAFPVEIADVARSRVVTNFLKWMVKSGYIPRFKQEMELGANYMLERGILITYVGWHMEDRSFLQRLSLEQISAINPELGEMIVSENDNDQVVRMLQSSFDGVSEARANKALSDLRELGVAELPIVRRLVNAPEVKTLAPDGDFIFPPYVTDPRGIVTGKHHQN